MKDDYLRYIELLVARFIRQPLVLKKFVRKNEYADDDLAEFLGLFDLDEDAKEGEAVIPRDSRRARVIGAADAILCDASTRAIPDYLESNLERMAQILGLNPIEQKVLCLQAFIEAEAIVADCMNLFKGLGKRQYCELVAHMIGVSANEVHEALSTSRPLLGSSLIRWCSNTRRGHRIVFLDDAIASCLLSDEFTVQRLIKAIARPAPFSKLHTEDYAQVGGLLGDIKSFLSRGMAERRRGINLFIYGQPGTGKSELARLIAAELGVALYEVAFENSSGDPISGQRRLEALRSSQCLLALQHALLVFDEAEDVFSSTFFKKGVAQEAKAWTNRILESNSLPTIWIANSLGGMDPAFVRRFDFVFELKLPPHRQRKQTYEKICAGLISPNLLDRMAADQNLTPAVVARSSEVVRSIHDGPEAELPKRELLFSQLLRNTLKAQGHATRDLESGSRIPPVFELDFVNADLPLAPIVEALVGSPNCRICLHGPPGTGKTTFGHWLANVLDLPVHAKKASDVLSPYIGISERNLARLFEEAREDRGLLIIDEVDTFLQDRRNAVRSWEVSLVNEFLTQVEQFEGILVVSTNLMLGIDQAALRRFDLKVHIDYLRPEQSIVLAERWCAKLGLGALDPASRSNLSHLANLTPGDFGNVARQHRFRRFPKASDMTAALVKECEVKEGARAKLGFLAP